MKPGDLIRTGIPYFYSTISNADKHISDAIIPIGTVGMILDLPGRFWVKMMLSDGKVGWMNWNYVEIISEAR